MISSTRLVLALAAMGLAAPAVGDDGAMAVLANNQLDALTASAMPPAARSGGAATALSGLSFDLSDHARDVAPELVSGLGTPQARAAGQGSGSSQNGSAGAPSSAAGGPGEMSAAAGSVLGGSFGRSVSARSNDSVGTASAMASGPGLSSVRIAAQSAPGFSSSASRSTSFSSR